jgi:hypothetical protein
MPNWARAGVTKTTNAATIINAAREIHAKLPATVRRSFTVFATIRLVMADSPVRPRRGHVLHHRTIAEAYHPRDITPRGG